MKFLQFGSFTELSEFMEKILVIVVEELKPATQPPLL